MPYEKIKIWMNLPLNDGRTKTAENKKIMRTFRITPKQYTNWKFLKRKPESAKLQSLKDWSKKQFFSSKLYLNRLP